MYLRVQYKDEDWEAFSWWKSRLASTNLHLTTSSLVLLKTEGLWWVYHHPINTNREQYTKINNPEMESFTLNVPYDSLSLSSSRQIFSQILNFGNMVSDSGPQARWTKYYILPYGGHIWTD